MGRHRAPVLLLSGFKAEDGGGSGRGGSICCHVCGILLFL